MVCVVLMAISDVLIKLNGVSEMKLEITLETMEEIELCIVHNDLDEDEAVEYAKEVLREVNNCQQHEEGDLL